MQERTQDDQSAPEAPAPAAPAAATPAFGRSVPQEPKADVDAMPYERAVLAAMTPEQRTAIYVNQIRKILIFFAVLAVVGIITGVILAIVDINAVHQANQGITPGY